MFTVAMIIQQEGPYGPVTNYGEGVGGRYNTGVGEGESSFTPYEKGGGGEKVLAMLKGGGGQKGMG